MRGEISYFESQKINCIYEFSCKVCEDKVYGNDYWIIRPPEWVKPGALVKLVREFYVSSDRSKNARMIDAGLVLSVPFRSADLTDSFFSLLIYRNLHDAVKASCWRMNVLFDGDVRQVPVYTAQLINV